MIFVAIFLTLVCISELSGLPINNDRIIYPDELDLDKIADEIGNLKIDQKSLFDDLNLLRFESITEEEEEEQDAKLEYGNHFQGDIILEEDQMELLKTVPKDGEDDEEFGKRTGLLWQGYRWTKDADGDVIMPYVIANHYSKFMQEIVFLIVWNKTSKLN